MSVGFVGSGRFFSAALLGWTGLALAAAAAGMGCRGHANDAKGQGEADAAAEGTVVPMAVQPGDGGAGGGVPANPRVAALVSPAPIFSATEFPPRDPSKASEERQGVMRLGYLRKGATVEVKPHMIKKSNCAEGWYELVSGGFVCG
ncbi:MAG TPA: hypothetical protein VNO21_13685, partial [Polyangiaceae bacterium]|nr:hypothetical protein [Polyangiaceae bacterium]